MLKLTYKKITHFDIIIFFRQLTTLINANIPILESLELLQKSQRNILLNNVIINLYTMLERGNYLSSTLKTYPEYFDDITCHLISIGEKSGTFPWVLEQITYQKEKLYQLKSKITHALFYPIVVTIIAMIIFLMMLVFIVPQFSQLFRDTHTTLPALTQIILTMSDFLRHHGYVLFFTVSIFILSIKSHPNTAVLTQSIIKLFHYFPLYQKLSKNISIIYFARYLSITLKAGLPISEAITLIMNTSLSSTFQHELIVLKSSIEKGEKIHKTMENSQYFPEMLIGMIKTGEESGKLDEVLEKISTLYENDIDKLISYASNLLEPLIMIVLGVLIGALIIAMYMPIFNLGTLM